VGNRTYDLTVRLTSLENGRDDDILSVYRNMLKHLGDFKETHDDIHVHAVVCGNETQPIIKVESDWNFMEKFNSIQHHT
jgi:hypothetical protein